MSRQTGWMKVVYSSIFTSNHNRRLWCPSGNAVVYSSIFTSNHNRWSSEPKWRDVVYSSIFTSNHNICTQAVEFNMLYILLSLHQTTTVNHWTPISKCCIFFYLYIKPQRSSSSIIEYWSCIFFYLYIKPQLIIPNIIIRMVVYSSIFTSNHNVATLIATVATVVYSSIFTSNHNGSGQGTAFRRLYILLSLHQTTTKEFNYEFTFWLYILLSLHQTTTT